MSNNVLFITYDGLTDQLGQSQILPYINGLIGRGFRFSILSFEKKNGLYSIEEISHKLEKLGIKWYPQQYTKNPPVLSTVIDVKRLLWESERIAKENNINLVHCRSYIPALAGLKLKTKYGIKFLFDMRGFWADERVDGGLWNLNNPVYSLIYKYFKRKEQAFLQNADHVISLTENGANEMKTWENSKSFAPVSIIPCSVDVTAFSPQTINLTDVKKLKNELEITKDDKILLYLGSVGTWYMLSEMLSFFEILIEKDSSWKFLFLTREKDLVEKEVREMGLDSSMVIITESQRDSMPTYISLADWGLFFIKPSYSKKSSSPTKQGELMSMGLPIITNAGVGDTDTIVKRFNSGIIVPTTQIKDLDEGVSEMLKGEFDKENIKLGAKSFFSLEKAIETYAKVYSQILS
ncbi:MAG: glycosyltransferase [Salibacteraceae bacterium]